MKNYQESSVRPSAFAGSITTGAVIGALFAAALVAAALASLGQVVAPDTEAVGSVAPHAKIERGGAITGYQLLL